MNRNVKIKWKMPERPECFFGRNLELSQLDFILHNGANIVFVQGIGGIGKSELVKQYALLSRTQYDVILYAQYVTDFRSLIASDIEFPMENMRRNTIDSFNVELEEEYFERKFKKLSEAITENTLLIIDNYNNPEDELLQKILELNCKMIFTSRCDWSKKKYPVLVVEELKKLVDIQSIFRHYYIPEVDEENVINEIIELLSRHTLSVEWVAKKLAEKKQTPIEIKRALEQKKNTDGEIVLEKLCEIFHFDCLMEEEKEVLRNLCFIPYTGIEKEEMAKRCNKGAHAAMLRLLRNSMIKQGNLDVITLHPVIEETVLYLIKPSWQNSHVFIESIVRDLKDDDLDINEIDRLISIAERIFRLLGMEDERSVDLIDAVIHVFVWRYKKYDTALGLLEKAISIEEKYIEQLQVKLSLCKEQNLMDISYNELKSKLFEAEEKNCNLQKEYGTLKYKMERYEEALACFMKLSKNPLVDVYCDIAKIYKKVNEYQKAIQYVKVGIKMKERKYQENHIPIVENYFLMADLYFCLEDKRNAMEWMEQAEEVANTQMSIEEKGDFYAKYASYLRNANMLEEALDYDQKAYVIKRKFYGENHMEVAKAYAAMSVDYYRLGDYISALECTLREIQVRKKLRHIKLSLYISVSRLVQFIDMAELSQETQLELEKFMSEFNRIIKENPIEGTEMMRQ